LRAGTQVVAHPGTSAAEDHRDRLCHGSRSFRRRGKPAVEVVEDGFDGWPQLVGDLLLALAFERAASGL
jgi:hypothetical protein